MILKKVKIEYYSDNNLENKQKIIETLKDFGIFELELEEDFTMNKLDYLDNFNLKKMVWSVIFCLPNNRFFDKIVNKISVELNNKLENCVFELYVNDLDTSSYKDEWKKAFVTTKIGSKIVINPSWIDYDAQNNEIVINIDPSMAFGTGTHETTSLCIDLIEKYVKTSDDVLDIGCGSGILMLVSKKLGAKSVTGIDIDKNCFDVVNNNFEKNGIKNDYEIIIGNLVDKIENKYNLVVSNILTDVLELLLVDILKVLKKGSIVIFSGILKEKEYKILNQTQEKGLKLIDKKEKNNWVGLVFEYEG
ncbi:50S ribosomal protein L11 methyltransferase [Caviibacter abscessus]|uniref:50S ribosomal protein L11 methyltransferase n=1 Tax=Caviibacter abscessus TaxID=1766719 RepID=UPI0008391B83|nr:50S ribosomal protein L11 methyltransferase [Caviibacter abscessus]